MRAARFLLGLVCLAALGAALYVAALDQHYAAPNRTEQNCGNALIANDMTRFSFSTGNRDDDDFAQDDVLVQCQRVIVRQRVYVVCILVAAAAAGIGATRAGRRDHDAVVIPGDPIV